MKFFKLSEEEEKTRLDVFLGRNFPEISREKIKKAIKEGYCRIDGQTADSPAKRLVAGQSLEFCLPETENILEAEEGELELLWRDEHMAVLNKPAGITVHPCPSCPDHTLVNLLLSRFPELKTQDGPRPGIVHRLDKETSGILLVALSENSRLRLSRIFAEREARKEYLALVYGVPESDGFMDKPIGRHPTLKTRQAVVPSSKGGKEAQTEYSVLYADPGKRYSLLRVRIHTGRTHQIRVHMSHLGHPLVGDSMYGKAGDPFSPRQMLHAWKISLPHPLSGENMSFSCPPPPDFIHAATSLAASLRRLVITGVPGCGKSTLVKLLGQEGWPVWSADESVSRLYQKGKDGWLFLHNRYGGRFTENSAEVERSELFKAMRQSPEMRREVEETIHAMVRHDLAVFWQNAEKNGHKAAVAEIPLYFESGISRERAVDQLAVGVRCTDEARKKRLAENRNWSESAIAEIDSWQWPQEKKLAACDLVVDNSGDEKNLAEGAKTLLKQVEKLYLEKEEKLAATLREIFSS